MSEYLCESLGKHHDRQGFHCGDTELDLWFQQRARQDQERHVAAVYVLVPVDEPTRVAGFYSLSATSVLLSDLPIDFARKLPRYPVVPAILLGRLARDVKFPGLGETLLLDALHRAWTNASKIAAAAVIVDATRPVAVYAMVVTLSVEPSAAAATRALTTERSVPPAKSDTEMRFE